MAVNQKSTVYADTWITHGGKLYRPGTELSGRMPDGAIRSAQEHGLVTDSSTRASEVKGAEQERQTRVDGEIASRSEKRGPKSDAGS